MKKFKLIRNIALPILAVGGTIIPLTTTSCANNHIPIAPNDFYTKTVNDNTFTKQMLSPWNDKWNVQGNFKWATDMANPSRYTDNMVKWDIIYQLCWKMADSHQPDYGVTFHFVSFQRQGIQVKYTMEMTTEWDMTTYRYFTIASSSSYDLAFTDMIAPTAWIGHQKKTYFIQTNYLAVTSGHFGDYGNYAMSYFLTDTLQG